MSVTTRLDCDAPGCSNTFAYSQHLAVLHGQRFEELTPAQIRELANLTSHWSSQTERIPVSTDVHRRSFLTGTGGRTYTFDFCKEHTP